ncbi:hypothetical protein [Streptomyces murinus]|uniref:hypothetical protein n=1 Tax=Streptomyces murinus TaxID=33900 RepID=UPI003813A452
MAVAGSLALVALLGVALFPRRVVGWFGGGGQDTTPPAAESERPRTSPGAEPDLRPTLTEPFRGPPAARRPLGRRSGEDRGLALPPRGPGPHFACEPERAPASQGL